jgi:hypothetical protein
MRPGEFLNVHMPDTKFGSGWRCVIVLAVGRKWTELYYPPTADTIKLPNEIAERLPREPVPIRKRVLAKRIRDNADAFGGMTRAAKEAVALIRS